jgi:hypothetical protein
VTSVLDRLRIHLDFSHFMSSLPRVQRAVRWYPPAFDIRVEDDVPVPQWVPRKESVCSLS